MSLLSHNTENSFQETKSIMNPNAGEWKPSVNAAAWTPGQGFQVPTPAPAPAPAAAATQTPEHQESTMSDIDENDPLWQAVLKIAEGDREKALTMINDPDSLANYPEVEAILAAGVGGGDDAMDIAECGDDATDQFAKDVDDKLKIDDVPTSAPDYDDDDNGDTLEIDPSTLKEGDPREHMNLVFIGHVDAGKSTLSGSILYITENVDKRTIERYEKEAKERNRESWFLAFIMDTNEEERAKGKTVEVGKAHFETVDKRYTILDAPGHKNYVPNMIMGASQADIGVLVISARKGEFETGFDRGGQTREHALLAKTLGVSHLVVVVNKMDDPTVQWSKQRYDECVTKLRPFLKQCGFTIKKEVKFIPISGLSGANVKDEVDPAVCSWWKQSWTSGENNTNQPSLLRLFDSLEIQGRDPTAPLRIPVLDRYTDRGTIAMGKVESGIVRPGITVTVMPTRSEYKVDAVWANEDPVAGARPGENVLIKLNGAGTEDVRKGYVLCTDPPCRAVDKIIAKIYLSDMPENTKIMTAGFQAVFHAHCCEEECTIVKIFETTNKKGQVVKNARFASIEMQCICMIEVARSVPVEKYDDYPFLGRFTLRTEGKTIAIGIITKLPPKKA
ncbi:translation elongation factor EF-1 subunit alpha [Nitzschia inconspicua]|uniref:Translation elongation factor EF-1 subunit alpha n=1 Tax=Nitzschia inconspicua TaxID=303405 RepID=A0A9K3LGL9_9STRA|nr:translation elongation factor EF-1 subunit alpha [Nitzschia inconspicua]